MAFSWATIEKMRESVPPAFNVKRMALADSGYQRAPSADADAGIDAADDVDDPALGTPDGGMAFTPLARMAGERPTVIQNNAPAQATASPRPQQTPDARQTPSVFAVRPAAAAAVDPAAPLSQTGETRQEQNQAAMADSTRRLTLDNLSMGAADAGRPTSFIASGYWASKRDNETATQKREREAMEQAYKTAREQLEARLRALDAQIAAIDKRLGEIDQELDALKEKNQALDELESLDQLDPNNPAHAAKLRKAGINPNDIRTKEDLDRAIAQQRGQNSTREGELTGEKGGLLRTRAEKARDRQQTQEQLAEVKQNPGSPRAQTIADRLAETEEGQRALVRTLAETQDDRVKNVAITAVVNSDVAQVREESLALAQNAVNASSATDLAETSSDDFDFNDPPPTITTASAATSVAPTPINAAPLKPAFASVSDPASAPTPVVPAAEVDVSSLLKPSSPGVKAG